MIRVLSSAFNTKQTVNNFLISPLLQNIDFNTYVTSTLIYSFGIIKVDASLSEN